MFSKSKLLAALLVAATASCIYSKKSKPSKTEPPQIHNGYLVLGHEAQSFTPCNDSINSYWVLGSSISYELDSLYNKHRHPEPYSEVLLSFSGSIDTTTVRDGFAHSYDGLVTIDSIYKVETLHNKNDCNHKLTDFFEDTFILSSDAIHISAYKYNQKQYTKINVLNCDLSYQHQSNGTLHEIKTADLNNDGVIELYCFYNSNEALLSSKLWAYSFENKTKAIPIKFKTETKKKGYRGFDRFIVYPNYIQREFPLYNDDDSEEQPTAGRWIMTYTLEKEHNIYFLVEKPGSYWDSGFTDTARKASSFETLNRQCFEYFDKSQNKVVSHLELRISDHQFEGLFGWDDGETDAFYGTLIKGTIDDKLLWAEYHYITEGEDMVQEVVFKKIQQGYLQGRGELYEDNGVYRIDRKKEINFATGLFYRAADCR